MTTITITPDMTMEEILTMAPSAQRALFQRFHVGGCSSCGFQPTDTLTQVCRDHNILDVNDAIRTIQESHALDAKMQVAPEQVKSWLDAREDFMFIDVRPPQEIRVSKIPGTEPLDYTNQERYMRLPKDKKIVFACRSGMRSLDVAAYFAGHGFTQVYSLRGGLLAWSDEVDRTVAKY
jgi:rhodanese-related sulfurtransferase